MEPGHTEGKTRDSNSRHSGELWPDDRQTRSPEDDGLRESNEMPGREKERNVPKPFGLTFHRRIPTGKQLKNDCRQDYQERELRHRPRQRPQKDPQRGCKEQIKYNAKHE